MRNLLLSMAMLAFAQALSAQTTYNWSGAISSEWNNPGNWNPAGVPAATDNVIIQNTVNICLAPSDISLQNLTLNGGTLDLAGYELSILGTNASFNSGTIQNGILKANPSSSISFGNGPVYINCKAWLTSNTITVRNGQFSDSLFLTKTGSSNDQNAGNNIFNGVVTAVNAGSGYWIFGNNAADTFNTKVSFYNTGMGNLYIAHRTTGHLFNGTVELHNSPASNTSIYVSHYADNTRFNDDIIINSTGGQGIYFCNGNSGASVIQTGGGIRIGTDSFNTGNFSLQQYSKTSSDSQSWQFTGSARLYIGPLALLQGDLSASAPSIYLHTSEFFGETDLEKTGGNDNSSNGGNTFYGNSSLTNSGSGYWLLGNKDPDTWNADVTFTNKGSDRLLPAWSSTGNLFNGNIYVNTIDSSRSIQFCGGNSSATAILAAGKTIQAGSLGLTTGNLYLRQFIQQGSVPVNLESSGNSSVYIGPGSWFEAPVTIQAPDIYPQGATYQSPVRFIKTGGSSNHNNQYQNIFNSTCTIEQQSNSGYFMLGYRTEEQFNDDIIVSCTGSSGIYLGSTSLTSHPVLAAGKTIRTGSAGFTAGFLSLRSFTQLGNAPISLDLNGGNAYLAIIDTSTIGGDLSCTSPGLFLEGSVFRGKLTLTKTGATNDGSAGGNVFEDSVTIFNTGTGNLSFASNQPDSFMTASRFVSSGSAYISLAVGATGNYFNGDITVGSTGNSTGIFFGNNSSAEASISSGSRLRIDDGGFNTGTLSLRRLIQHGSAATDLTLDGLALLRIGPSVEWNGNFTSSSPALQLNGGWFHSLTSFTKTGSSNDYSNGGNIFEQTSSITHQGSGFLLFGNNTPDTWNGDLILQNEGTDRILLGWNTVGNQFNGDIYFSSSNGSSGIQFSGGNSNATSILAAGKTLATGAGGYNGGNLILRQFTQLGAAPVILHLASTASSLQYGPHSSFGGNVESTSQNLFFHSTEFSGTLDCTKSGSGSDYSNGGNIFHSAAIFNNAGSGSLVLANGTADTFESEATFNNTGSGNMYPAYDGTGNLFYGTARFNNKPAGNTAIYVSQKAPGTLFYGDIIVNSTAGQGVRFCESATGSALLADGRRIQTGADGFTSGYLSLLRFTQQGTTSQSLTITGSGGLIFGPSAAFFAELTCSSPSVFFNGCLFHQSLTSTKTGSTNDQSKGGNSFYGTAEFINAGTGSQYMTVSSSDNYFGNTTFRQNNTGRLYPNYNNTGFYEGDVSIISPAGLPMQFGNNAGIASFQSGSAQSIRVLAGSPSPVIARLTVANTGSGVTLDGNVEVSKDLTLTAGLLHTSSSSMLTLWKTAVAAAGTAFSTSYVDGPMRYQKGSSGLSTLQFPVGKGIYSRPVVLTVSHTNGNTYTYETEVFNESAEALNYTLPLSVERVSQKRYYKITRRNNAGVEQPVSDLSGNAGIQLFFGQEDGVTDGASLTIVKNIYTAPSNWIDIGGAGAPAYSGGTSLTGSVNSTSSPTAFNSFSTFALANKVAGINVLPVQLTSFKAVAAAQKVTLLWTTQSEWHNDYFTIERSADGISFSELTKVGSKAANGVSVTPINYEADDNTPLPGLSYYRLRQTDLDGKVDYSKTVSVNLSKPANWQVFPNPGPGLFRLTGLPADAGQLKCEWFSMSGILLQTQVQKAAGGMAEIETSLNNGIYLLKITAAGQVLTKTVRIQK